MKKKRERWVIIKMSKTIKHKKIKGKMTVLKVMLYKGHNIYIRMLYGEYFEYVFSHENEIFSSYMLIRPRKGENKLSDDEISQATALIWSGATTTVDVLTGTELSDEDKKKVEAFEQAVRSSGVTKEVKE